MGQLEWAQPIIDTVLRASNATLDCQVQQILQTDSAHELHFRFQVELSDQGSEIADASEQNLRRLMDLTRDYLGHSDTKDKRSRRCGQLIA